MNGRRPGWAALALLAGCLGGTWAEAADRLVFGSFHSAERAERWAQRVAADLAIDTELLPTGRGAERLHRVVSQPLSAEALARLRLAASSRGLSAWRLRAGDARREAPAAAGDDDGAAGPAGAAGGRAPPTGLPATADAASARADDARGAAHGDGDAPAGQGSARRAPRLVAPARPAPAAVTDRLSIDLGFQSRSYAQRGFAGQDRFEGSLAAGFEWLREWDDGHQAITVVPFFRYDSADDRRTHGDLREAFWSRIGDDWELHVGARRVFWGVTEFRHLVDIVNQTDLVENIDGEDKLGQPMIQLSLVRDFGLLDLYLLTGFRERTFPGSDGRLRPALPVAVHEARYESGAGRYRVDGAVRWSRQLGALEFGLHHFSGTSRDPLFEIIDLASTQPRLRPVYPVIDQTGLDAQAIVGPWAFKLEAMSRSGFGPRYESAVAGFERTLVGAFGGRSDLGLVLEYLWDERDERAFDNPLEHDLALGTRWSLNDLAGSTALFGLIWDHDTGERIWTLEANRRLGDTWTLALEGRLFDGGQTIDQADALPAVFDPDNRLGALQQDDFLQLELTKFL